ncbi:50S ribosomal protein L32 [Candidatus Sumerlaeota bacterium]|nr:50S ribosomal protein L32 [Candidatus Sumerlaeota bacterium]
MPVPRRRHCPSRRRRGRTNKNMTAIQGLSKCPNCEALILPHRMCPSCGTYKGRQYMTPKVEKQQA